MEFTSSEELLEIKRIARDFAEKEIRPHVMEWDEKQIFPRETLKKLADLGFLGVLIPADYGGSGLGYVEYVAIIEELSRVDGSIGISVAAHNSLRQRRHHLRGRAVRGARATADANAAKRA